MLQNESVKAGFHLKKLAIACFCLGLSACTTTLEKNDVDEQVSLIKLGTKDVAQTLDDYPANKTKARTLMEHRGTGSFIDPVASIQPVQAKSSEQGEMVKVTFEGAPIGSVLEAILGDLLKVPYSLEGDIQGQITLMSTDPVPQAALLDMLESTLEIQGIAMVKGGNGIYRIGRSEHLRREIPVEVQEAASDRGYSVRIIPLQHFSVLEAEKVLTPLGLQQNILRIDPLRNILMLGASAPQMKNALRTLKMLDVDVLSGMSFGIYEVVNLDASLLVERIEKMITTPVMEGLTSTTRLVSHDEIKRVTEVAPNSRQ